MKNATKKRLTIAGLGIVSLALVVAIYFQFTKNIPANNGIMPAPAPVAAGEITPPDIDTQVRTGDTQAVTSADPAPAPDDNTPAQTDQPVQSLQPDVTKPTEPTQAQKTDPTQKPDGQKVDKVEPTDHDNVQKPDPPQTDEPQGGEQKDGMVYLPGFGWVTETGGSGSTVGDEGDELTGNKVGTMD